MMRRLLNNDVGRRGSTAPGPGVGVLLKKLRSRWLVLEPTYSMSMPPLAHSFPLNVDAPLILARVRQMARRRNHVGRRRRAGDAGGMVERQRRIGRIEV